MTCHIYASGAYFRGSSKSARRKDGTMLLLVIAISASSGVDLEGASFNVLQGDEIVSSGVLPPIIRADTDDDSFDPRDGPRDRRDHVSISLQAPQSKGEFNWILVVPDQVLEGLQHRGPAWEFSFRTNDHKVGLVCWDEPTSIVCGEAFTIKVGAKCSAECCLQGLSIDLTDKQGMTVASAELGTETWPDAIGLYCTELALVAPPQEGVHQYVLASGVANLTLPHSASDATLTFATIGQGVHAISVSILDRGTNLPIWDAQVRLGFQRAATDETGAARFMTPSGSQKLFVWKAGYKARDQLLDIECDEALMIRMDAMPAKNPYARWDG
ncbi:MAG: hypothetical protein JWL62_2093 [Hyphomicrobiales bacterium]|nr:hypothetical protein [Hyphomicrobiales bacterium]